MIHTVYKTTNLINGKYYIGKHSTENINDNYLGSGIALLKAISKYGRDKFVKQILFQYTDEAAAYATEHKLIIEADMVNDPQSYNLCYGGLGFWQGSTHTIETRKKISEGNKGKVRSDTAKIKYSTAKRGIPKSADHKQKLSDINTGKIHTQETKDKISAANTGRTLTQATKDKISASNKGRPSNRLGTTCSNETKARMSAAQKGRIVSTDARAKLSVANTGENNPNFGTMWITNEEENMKIKKTDVIPDGWRRGRIFKKGYNHVRNK
jgi:hypothetical protein